MKIGIDIRCLVEGKRTGVEEYTIALIKNTLAIDSSNEYIFFINSFKNKNIDLRWLKKYPNAHIKKFRIPNKLLNFSMYFFGFPKINKLLGGVDMFYMPNINFIALGRKCKKIITVHDLSFERFSETFSFKRKLWHFMVNTRKLCRDFDKVVAVSQSTKDDIVNLYGIDDSKIIVNFPYLGLARFRNVVLSPGRLHEIKKKYNLSDNYILYLGTIEPRKNIESLIEAFECLKDEVVEKNVGNAYMHSLHSNLKLVIAGTKGWKCESIYKRYETSSFKKDIIFTEFVEDEDKPYLYRLAKVFVYPSFFEGFGFPPAEAMMSGVPVVTSNCSSLPEVVGDSAVMIDPYRPYEITLALKHLLSDENLHREYCKRGEQRGCELESMERKDIFE